MYLLTRNWYLVFAAASAFAVTAASLPTYAEEPSQNLGPVGPNEPILTTVGGKRVIAFYKRADEHCGIHIVLWDHNDVSADSAARFRVTLDPRQLVHIDTAENGSLDLRCGERGDSLAIVEPGQFIAAGAAQ